MKEWLVSIKTSIRRNLAFRREHITNNVCKETFGICNSANKTVILCLLLNGEQILLRVLNIRELFVSKGETIEILFEFPPSV